MQKTILFDLDGTLTNSSEGIIKSCIHTFSHYGIDVPEGKQNTFIGPPLRYSFNKYGIPENEIENALARYRERYIRIGKFENHPYDGITEVLTALKIAGHRLFVATSKPEQTSCEILDHFGMSKYFEGICGATFDKSRDSKQAVIQYLLEKHQPQGKIIMVGDTVFDVEGASAFGIPTVGVGWGFGKPEDMLAAGAVKIAYNMNDLLEILI